MDHQKLDRVVWEALSTRQRGLALVDGQARRYPAAVAPFAATLDDGAASFRDLLGLLAADDRVALVTTGEIGEPKNLNVVLRDVVDQMVLDGPGPEPAASRSPKFVPLQAADVPEMLALAEATRPGPFGPRTIELGDYLGVKEAGRLVAMAGERMRLEGCTEVSAVCVAPSHRGLGLAGDLMNAVARGILARGEIPFLHVFASNAPAIALYRKLGFVRRRQLHLTAMKRSATP